MDITVALSLRVVHDCKRQ